MERTLIENILSILQQNNFKPTPVEGRHGSSRTEEPWVQIQARAKYF
jgi:hypothetical protein